MLILNAMSYTQYQVMYYQIGQTADNDFTYVSVPLNSQGEPVLIFHSSGVGHSQHSEA